MRPSSLQIDQLLERKPRQLSGGQRQRVAIGRAITRDPKIFLFDEPLSNLDAELRVLMRLEISKLHDRLGNTMIYVTHDQVEAMTMADRIVVLRAGVIEQVGAPLELYNRPRNKFVAGFIGSPRMNFIPGASSRAWAIPTSTSIAPAWDALDAAARRPRAAGGPARERSAFAPRTWSSVGRRPQRLDVKVDVIEQHGSSTYLHCALPGSGSRCCCTCPGRATQHEGDSLNVRPARRATGTSSAPDEQRIAEKRA